MAYFRTIQFLVVGVACAIVGCSVIDGTSSNSCVSREGECFDLSISGVEVVPLSGESKKLLSSYKKSFPASTQADIHYTKWETETPISGKLTYDGSHNKQGAIWFGNESGLSDPIVVALDGQKLKFTHSITSSAPGDPRGAALLSKQLAQDSLPAGNYIFILDYSGNDNWDRKHVLVKVK